jgi:hypothetical protein
MRPSPADILVVGACLFLCGLGLVLASGHGGNSEGGSELVWQLGGLMVSASIPVLLVAGLARLAGVVRTNARGPGR